MTQRLPGPDGYAAFVPAALPPDPPLDLSGKLGGLLERASSSLGRLDGLSRSLEILNRTDDLSDATAEPPRSREDAWREGFERSP